jgi:hypothetical protein
MEHQVLSPKRRQHNWLEVLRAFVVAEGRGLVAALWRPLWKVGLAVAVPVFLVLAGCVLFRRVAPEHETSVPLMLLVALGFSLLYGALAGCTVGLVYAGRHLVGNKFFWALLGIGLAVLMTVSLLLNWIDANGKDAVRTLAASAASHGFLESAADLDADALFGDHRFTHLWPPLKVLMAPLLVADTPQALADADFLWNYYVFLRTGAFAVLLGLIPSYLAAVGVLWRNGLRRLLERYRKFVADYGVIARY